MKIISFFFLILMMCGFVFAKSPLPELEKVKEIKLLESTRDDVKEILAGYEHDAEDDDDYEQYFSTEKAKVTLTFAKGDCSDEAAYWNVAEWTVTKIKIEPEDALKSENFDFSNFKKEIEDEESPESYTYHDEKAGIAFVIDEDEVEKIFLYPPKSKNSRLCNNEKTQRVASNEKRVIDLILEEPICILINKPADVVDLILSAGEITINCDNSAKNEKCRNSETKISVKTNALDPEGDVLTYSYDISAGKIVGQGFDVIWDLSGVQPGTYTITAGVDDSAGVVGRTVTKMVVVKDAPAIK